jgi:hypothetical protein
MSITWFTLSARHRAALEHLQLEPGANRYVSRRRWAALTEDQRAAASELGVAPGMKVYIPIRPRFTDAGLREKWSRAARRAANYHAAVRAFAADTEVCLKSARRHLRRLGLSRGQR